MKKVLFSIFAHPDDEAFGPSGTLIKEASDGAEVHLILATAGDQGCNDDKIGDLAKTRLDEWRASGTLIGVAHMKYLNVKDGCLCNEMYLSIANSILLYVQDALRATEAPVTIELLTFEPRGITGHLDHIAISMITSYVYLELKKNLPTNTTLGHLKYFCLSKESLPEANTNWIYMPAGLSAEQIDEVVDVSDVMEQKLEVMKAHYTQRKDMNDILNNQDVSKECFYYYK